MENRKNKYLALSEEIDFDNQAQIRKAIIRLLILEIGLQVLYQLGPVLIKLLHNHNLREFILALLIVVLAGVAIRFSYTTKVLNFSVKRYGLAKLLTIVYWVLVGFLVFGNLLTTFSVWKLPVRKIIEIALIALDAGICEEFLFRGVLFNLFVVTFHKSKYDLLWASIGNSVLFGLLHLVNLTHQSVASTVGQIIFAIGLGLILSYLHILSNGIFWCIAFHFLQDFSPQVIHSDLGNPHISLVLSVYGPIILFMVLCIYLFNHRLMDSLKQ